MSNSLIMMEHDNVIAQRDSLAILSYMLDNLARGVSFGEIQRVGLDLGIFLPPEEDEDGATFYRFSPGLLADLETGRARIFERYRKEKH